MTEAPSQQKLTPEDMSAIAASLAEGGEAPKMNHTILRVWKEILGSIESGAADKISPALAVRILQRWDRLDFADLQLYWELYHRRLTELRGDLHEVIDADPECFERVEDDAIDNRDLYDQIIFLWKLRTRQWELSWDVSGRHAAIEMAALADAAEFVAGQHGIIEQLMQPQVGFEWTELDEIRLQEKLDEALAEATGGSDE